MVGGQDHERGMLKKGFVADFVILNGEPDPDYLPLVDETWIAGNRDYSRCIDLEFR